MPSVRGDGAAGGGDGDRRRDALRRGAGGEVSERQARERAAKGEAVVKKRAKQAVAPRDARELVLDYVDARPVRGPVAAPHVVVALIEPLLERLRS